jgi:ribosomal protein L37AE/L43A
MTLDRKKYPMLFDLENPPTCRECGEQMMRYVLDDGIWLCLGADCDATDETDAELDNRLTSEAEAAFERNQERGSGAGFLSPDALQRSLKR